MKRKQTTFSDDAWGITSARGRTVKPKSKPKAKPKKTYRNPLTGYTASDYAVHRWWEDSLSSEERTKLMGSYEWHGTVAERHKKLLQMHKRWKRTIHASPRKRRR